MFFSDIAGFTSIVEGLPPERSIVLLSRYFDDMWHIIRSCGGIVIEFIGDAILAVFGAPTPLEDAPKAGINAALKMLRGMRGINDFATQRGLPQVAIRAGVHTGVVLIGNIGFQQRLKYGIVGEETGIPAHLEEMNKHYGTKMLASAATVGRLDGREYVVRPVDLMRLRHDETCCPDYLYEVLGYVGRDKQMPESYRKVAEACKLHRAAFEAYLARDFHRAQLTFRQVTDMMTEIKNAGEDGPSELMARRCQFYMESPPPESWDGVWDQGGEP